MANVSKRKRAEIDWPSLQKLAIIQCTAEEIVWFSGVSLETLIKDAKEKFGMTFHQWMDQFKHNGRSSLRRMQWQKAANGDTRMQIWLGKQYLGQSDKVVAYNHEMTEMTEQELADIVQGYVNQNGQTD